VIRDRRLFEPTKEGEPPKLWVRCLLILTCSGVSFAHGSNDGQKSIGLIMLTVIGVLPAQYTLNLDSGAKPPEVVQAAQAAVPLIQHYGDDQKELAVRAAQSLSQRLGSLQALSDIPARERSAVRDDIYRLNDELKLVAEHKQAQPSEKKQSSEIRGKMRSAVEYAPWWVRVLSALCLGAGTMVGYKRIVTTIGERIGKKHLTPGAGRLGRARRGRPDRHRRLQRVAGQHDAHPVLGRRRHHGRRGFRHAMGHGAEHGVCLDTHPARHHPGVRMPVLGADPGIAQHAAVTSRDSA